MGINDNFKYLNVGLPNDIERRKQHGDLKGAIRLIDQRLGTDIPDALKSCMIAEREIMLRLPSDYPFSRAEALKRIRADVPDFSDAEFDGMVDAGRIDWIYLEGEERYFDRFYETLIKTNAEFAARAGQSRGRVDGEDSEDDDKALLKTTLKEMREAGGASYRFTIRASVRIEDDAFVPGKKVLVHIPIPSAARQISDIKLLSHSDNVALITPEDYGQRTIAFEEVMKENHEFFVEYSYVNTVKYVDAYSAKGSGEQPDFHTEEQYPHIVFTPYIKELVNTLTAGVTDPMEKARIFYDFITLNVKYSYMREYFGLTNIAETCARDFRGDCGVQALLFITLCRCAGIPAKWQSAMAASPYDIGSHDWAEFYIAPYGWLFADPSYGGGAVRVGDEERRRFYFGNLDPFRMIANSEFQCPLLPEKAHWRADPYDNQSGEIEYEDRGLRLNEYDCARVMTAWEKLPYKG